MNPVIAQGFVDQIRDGVAYVTLQTEGETLWGELPASWLDAHGVRERRRFTCEIRGDDIIVVPIPDCVITEERERAITEEIAQLLGDDPEDDYNQEGSKS